MLAELSEVWVLTRANNRRVIEPALRTLPTQDRLHFVYVDLPSWARLWKRGQRGVRAYYLLWQLAALLRARRMHRVEPFHLSWHLTMANAWLGSAAALVGPPFVYGPVGGGIGMPWRLLHAVGARAAMYEVVRAWARFAGRYVNPLARVAWRRAVLILVQNPETAAWFPRNHRSKTVVFPHAVVTAEKTAAGQACQTLPTALFAGRLLGWKGVALAIRAVAGAPEWRLIVCGSGPDEQRLRRLAKRLALDGRVEFRGWQPREKVLQTMRGEVDVLLFPSLHDDAPLAVTDALASGLSVICLDRGGPPVLAGSAGRVAQVRDPATELARLLVSDPPQTEVVQDRANELSIESRVGDLRRLLLRLEIASHAVEFARTT
jgi:glycosyltransferase involved in cell wall biosynthesis